MPKKLIFILVVLLMVVALPWGYRQIAFSQKRIDPYHLSLSNEDMLGEYYGLEIPVPGITDIWQTSYVLGITSENKRIEVDLTNQKLLMFEGTQKVGEYLISSGKWGRTPTGIFEIWAKVLSTKMEGGSKELRTYYNLPRVPYTMFFYNKQIPQARGYGIHGAYWHNNFGNPMSHGCINMKPEEAKVVYEWADPIMPEGVKFKTVKKDDFVTPVIIYGKAPQG